MPMHDLDITCKVRPGGRLSPEDSATVRKALEARVGRWVEIKIQDYGDTRSKQQNAYHFGVCVKMVHRMFLDAGNDVTAQDVHEYLKQHVGGDLFVKRVRVGTRWDTIVKSSAKLKVREWEDWMEKIRAWAATLGLIIPLPNEELVANVE
jgi:hypothetical protein